MALPSIIGQTEGNWAGAYPLDFTLAHDATGASLLLVFFYGSDNHTYTPVATFNGVTMTLLTTAFGGSNHGVIWVWALNAPPTGTHDIEISSPGNYGSTGVAYAVSLASNDPDTPTGDIDAICGTTSAATSLTLVGGESLIVGFGAGFFAPLQTTTGSPSITVVDTNTTNSDFPAELITQDGGTIGATDSATWHTAFNNANGALVEVLGNAAGFTITAAPLVATFSLGAVAVVTSQDITAGPLSATFSLGSAVVDNGGMYAQTIDADPLLATFALGPAHVDTDTGVTFPFTLAPAGTMHVSIRFAPSVPGVRTGQMTVLSNAATSPDTVSLSGSGTGVPVLLRLSTSGNQIVDSNGDPVRLRSVNWFGAESTTYCPHGMWARRWSDMLDQIAALGFNCIRLPFSDDILNDSNVPNGIDFYQNPDLEGLTPLQVLDKVIDYGAALGIRFVLDHHRTTAGAGTDGWPPSSGDGGYSLATWAAMWTVLATRYTAKPAVCGFDPHNEPHNPTWDTWAGYVEDLADAVHAVAPDWICFCEGVGTFDAVSYWWGGQLAGVATRPVVLTATNKLAYSPHEYGQSVAAGQAWLQYEGGGAVPGWPTNLYAKWQSVWGFIFEDGIAPIWIGEFGGFFGIDGSGTDFTKPNRTEERQWLAELCKYLNGDFDGNDVTNLTGDQVGMSFAYWSFNPNSGDTGGLIEDDWTTTQTAKRALLDPLFPAP